MAEWQAALKDAGYAIIPGLLQADAVQDMYSEIGRILDAGDGQGFQLDSRRSDDVDVSGREAYRSLGDSQFQSRVLWEQWLTAQAVLDLHQQLLGDDIRVQGTRFFTKAAGTGEATPWHQDIWIWESEPDSPRRLPKQHNMSCWVALEDIDLDNGCLHVVPGSHLGPVIEHRLYPDSVHEQIPKSLTAHAPVVPVPLRAGDAVVWHAHLWHMSPPNRSQRTRWGGVMVTMAEAYVEQAEMTHRPFILRDGCAQAWPGASLVG